MVSIITKLLPLRPLWENDWRLDAATNAGTFAHQRYDEERCRATNQAVSARPDAKVVWLLRSVRRRHAFWTAGNPVTPLRCVPHHNVAVIARVSVDALRGGPGLA